MGTSPDNSRGVGMEPPELLEGLEAGTTEGQATKSASGARPFPSVKDIRAAQLTINERQRQWLATCRRLCELRLPGEVFKSIPNEIWDLLPWGTKVVVMRAPKVGQHGGLIVPEMAQKSNFHGWVLTVGDSICDPNTPDQIVRGKTCPYWGLGPNYDPLLLVGEMMQFNPTAGRVVSTTRMTRRAEEEREFLITSIADLWGPIPNPSEDYWSPKLA